MTTVHRAQLVIESSVASTRELMRLLSAAASSLERNFPEEELQCLVVDMEDEVK